MLRTSFHEVGGELLLFMTGHADYAAHGQDIVCAAASIMATALDNSLLLLEAEKQSEAGPGKTILRCRATEQTRTLFTMAAVGLCQLAAAYPAHVTVCMDDFALMPEPP